MNHKLRICLSFLFLSMAHGLLAQDVHFSQFYENALLRNPALTGVFSGDYKVGFNYRDQWSGFSTPFKTALLSAETRVLILPGTGDYLSMGLTAVYDKAGTINFTGTSVYGAVNYNKSLGDCNHTYLSVGLAGGYIQRSVDFSKMRFSSQYVNGSYVNAGSPAESMNATSIRHFDASAGISLNGSLGKATNYYLGVAGYHVSKPKESYLSEDLIRLSTRWTGSAGVSMALNERASVVLHVNYQRQEPYEEIIGGGLLRYVCNKAEDPGKRLSFSAGCFYRYQDAIIPTVKLDYGHWAITASYDLPTGSDRIYTGGLSGYEMSLYCRGTYRHRRQPTDVLSCPRFEGQSLNAEIGY